MLAFARFLILLVLGAALVHASPTRVTHAIDTIPQTNAARLARGLPPLAPRRLYTPTRVKRDGTSPTPTFFGRLAVYKSGVLQGYVSPPAGATPSVVANAQMAATFQYTKSTDPSTPVFLQAQAGGKYLAFGSNTGEPSLLSSTSASFARALYGTEYTPAGSVPRRDSLLSTQYDETTVFVIDPVTRSTSIQFVNYDGTRPNVAIVGQGAYIYVTGSASRFMATASGSAIVTLTFEPLSS